MKITRLVICTLLFFAGFALPLFAQEGNADEPNMVEAAAEGVAEAADVTWNRVLFTVANQEYTLGDAATAGVVFVASFLILRVLLTLLKWLLAKRLGGEEGQGKTVGQDALYVVLTQTKSIYLIIVALYLVTRVLGLITVDMANSILIVASVIQVGLWATAVLIRSLKHIRSKKEETDPGSVSAFGLISIFGRLAIWSVVVLLILTSLGISITPLIASLGVGGIAIAFALQSILGDIFSSVAILLDKPFVLGDFVIVGDMVGVVEHIGLKTTRVRSLWGEQIVFSNTDLLNSRIRNFKRMFERRIVFGLGVVYQTTPEQLEKIPQIIKEAVEQNEKTRFDRSHFSKYGDFSLDFENVYFILDSDYNVYMDIQQAINLFIFRRFKEEGIEFAYPTQELIVHRPEEDGGQE